MSGSQMDVVAARECIKLGADVNVQGEYALTALHVLSAVDGYEELIEELINAGGDVNARDYVGQTPLHEAVRRAEEDGVYDERAGSVPVGQRHSIRSDGQAAFAGRSRCAGEDQLQRLGCRLRGGRSPEARAGKRIFQQRSCCSPRDR
eukprot:757823-Hanusia_phi.AAC.3